MSGRNPGNRSKIREGSQVITNIVTCGGKQASVVGFMITVYHKHLYKVLLHSTRVALVLLVDHLQASTIFITIPQM